MKHTRSTVLCSIALLAALIILIVPGTALAAPAYGTIIADAPIQPTFSLPGIFSLTFGDDISTSQIEIPALNATAAVDGLTLGPTLGWNSITLSQQQPAVTGAGTISGAEVNVGGPESGYSGSATAQIELHPGPGLQADGKVGIVYNGMNKSAGVMLQDASVKVPTWPVGLDLAGINTEQGALTVDSAQVGLPVIASTMQVNGLRTGSTGTSWDSLTLAQSADTPLKIGEAATITDIQLDVPATGTEQPTTATARVKLHPGPGFQAEGTVGVVRDAASGSSGMMIQDASVTIPTWPVGLVMTGINTGPGMLTVDSTQVGLPVAGSAVTINGLQTGSSGTSWDSLTLAQSSEAPLKVGNVATISGIELDVPAPGTGQGVSGSAQVSLHPGPALQAEGTVAVGYDEASGSSGVMLKDGSVIVPTWPVGLAITGINTGQGGLTIDSAQVGLPVAGSQVTVNGLRTGSNGTSWESLSFAQSPDAAIKIGDMATISGIELSVPSAGTEQATTLSANFEFNAGNVAHLQGEVIGVKDATGGPSGVAIKDTTASVQIPGWDLQFTGINSVQGGVKVDKITFAAEPIDLTAELMGVTVGGGGGMTFDEALVTSGSGFQMTMTRTDAGYIMTTTSLLPVAAR